jgi:oxaloacetate decarboxylase alpha subunit
VIRNGIRRIWVAESMNDVETALRIARIAKEEQADEVVVGLVYSISPVHTDDYYAARARAIAASADVDVLNLKDPGGLLTPERVRTLVPALRAAALSLPLEVHSHCTATMAPLVYLESARLGASFLCTAVGPLANGTSQPSAEQTLGSPPSATGSNSTAPIFGLKWSILWREVREKCERSASRGRVMASAMKCDSNGA